MKKTLLFLIFFGISFPFAFLLIFIVFGPIFNAKSLIFPYAIHPFDIVSVYPDTWILLKKFYFFSFFISYSILFYRIFNLIYIYRPSKTEKEKILLPQNISELSLFIGLNNNQPIFISEKGLYQNILITGTIGAGKTSSAMYPFTKQLIDFSSDNPSQKLAMLVLDVKGNYFQKVLEYANNSNRLNDVITIDLSGKFKYNPLDKPELKPIVLANRLKTILSLFSPNNSESFWLDKAEQILSECIKFCRLYNDGYVTFSELHKLLMFPEYYQEKLEVLKILFKQGKFNDNDVYNLLTCIDFFEKEFFSLDTRTISILKSEISRITSIFVSDYSVSKSFCSPKNELNFHGFKDVLKTGKIVVLNMNISEYKNLSKIIAAYLKLDFQTEVLSQLSNSFNNSVRKSVFISDEFHEYVTTTDSDFFAQSREAKCINIIATQSYSSIKNSLKDETATKVIIQNMINKLWFRTTDNFTIDEAQKQIGKEEKEKISTTISENAKETNLNLLTNTLISRNSNISESYNKYTQNDYIYDTNYFSQSLETFRALAFISNGFKVSKPLELQMIPYYKDNVYNSKILYKERNKNEK